MTTLLPGMSSPSFSASSTMRFAIRSLTEPPADMYSTFPTVETRQYRTPEGGKYETTDVGYIAGFPYERSCQVE